MLNAQNIDLSILKEIGLLPIVNNGFNYLSWFTAEWLFSTFFPNTKIVFHSEELAAQWRSNPSICSNGVKSPLLYFPDVDLFQITSGGSVDHCPITSNGKEVGMYHFNNGGLFHFELHNLNVDLEALETKYVELYNKKHNTSYMTLNQYRQHLENKYGSSNPYKSIPKTF